jgi:hypothetical protein
MILATRNGCSGADSNVLVAGLPMGTPNVIPRRCTLARVVLSFQLTFSILSLGFLMTSFSGCVLPVGPRFEDPPTTENVPPFINSTDPPQGMVVPAVNKSANFRVTFTDLNDGDALVARWVAEYPPFTSASHLLQDVPAPIPAPPGLSEMQSVGCALNALALNTNLHSITVFISDQPFWIQGDPDAPTDPFKLLTQNKANSVMAQANWVLSVQCP